MEEKVNGVMDTLKSQENQLSFLLKLSDALRPLGNPVDIEESATKIALDFMAADRCYYSTIEGDNVIILHDAVRGDLPSVSGVHTISGFALYKAVLSAGRPFVVDDVCTSDLLDDDLKDVCLQFQYGSFINVPVIKNNRPVGLFSLVQNTPRKWTSLELQLSVETAERTWAAVQRAKAEEALRKSEEKYRMLFDSIDEGCSILEILFDEKGKAVDYIFLEMNNAHEAMTGLPQTAVGMRISELMPDIEENVLERLGEIALTGKAIRYEQYVKQWNRWFDVHSSRVGGDDSRRVANVFNNITERKLAEEKIKKSESRFRTMADASPVLIWTIDADGLSAYYNKTFRDFIGADNNEDISDWKKIVHPDDVQSTMETINSAISERRSYSLECRLLRSDGQWRWVLAQGHPRLDTNDEFLGFVGSSVDITERHQAQEKVKESEKRFQAAIGAVEGIIWTNNAIGEMEGEQPGWTKLTGQTYEEYHGYGWSSAVHPEDAQPTVDAWNKAVKSKSTFEFEHRVKTKEDGWKLFSVKAVPAFDESGAIKQWVGVHTDITGRKTAEQKLAYRTALLEAHNEASVDGLLLVDAKGKIISFNKRFTDIWNMPQHIVDAKDDEAALSFAMTQLVNPQQFIDKVKYLYEHPTETSLDELHFKDGKVVERNGYPVVGEDGFYYAWSWTFRDITEQKNYEKTIIESEERFRLLADESPMFVFIIEPDASASMSYWNKTWLEYTGQTFDEAKGRAWDGIIHPDDLSIVMNLYVPAFTNKQSYFIPAVRTKRYDGEYRWYAYKGNPRFLRDGEFNGYIGVGFDVHEQKTTEERLEYLVAERTKELQRSNDDLQQFAHVASHDLKEPIRKIKTFTGRLEDHLHGHLDETSSGYIERIHAATNRMFNMIDGVLTYSTTTNASTQKPELINLNEVIKSIENDLDVALHKTDATLLYKDLPSLEGAPVLLYQLFYNLINNANKFVQAGVSPVISISSETLIKDGKDFVRITIQDNGIGFKPEHAGMIFETFTRLNSKDKYEGTGLGLSLCKKIVERHGGTIVAQGTPNNGAKFIMTLPVQQNRMSI